MSGYPVQFISNVSFTALNVSVYTARHYPVSLGAAIVCGALALWALVMEVGERWA